jgi:hypothetical protein
MAEEDADTPLPAWMMEEWHYEPVAPLTTHFRFLRKTRFGMRLVETDDEAQDVLSRATMMTADTCRDDEACLTAQLLAAQIGDQQRKGSLVNTSRVCQVLARCAGNALLKKLTYMFCVLVRKLMERERARMMREVEAYLL